MDKCDPNVTRTLLTRHPGSLGVQSKVPARSWGVFVRLRFSVDRKCVRERRVDQQNDLWVKQSVRAEGEVWYSASGPRHKFTKEITEFFKLSLPAYSPEAPSEWESHADDQQTYWYPGGKRGSGEAAGSLPCGVEIEVHATIAVGHLRHAGSNAPVSGRKFAYDDSTRQFTGPVSLTIPHEKGVLAAPAIGGSAHTTAPYYFDEDRENFRDSSYSYRVSYDACPGGRGKERPPWGGCFFRGGDIPLWWLEEGPGWKHKGAR